MFEVEVMLLLIFLLFLNMLEFCFLFLGVEGFDGELGFVFLDVDDVFRVVFGIECSGNFIGCNVMFVLLF